MTQRLMHLSTFGLVLFVATWCSAAFLSAAIWPVHLLLPRAGRRTFWRYIVYGLAIAAALCAAFAMLPGFAINEAQATSFHEQFETGLELFLPAGAVGGVFFSLLSRKAGAPYGEHLRGL
jgi:hypothetical protein